MVKFVTAFLFLLVGVEVREKYIFLVSIFIKNTEIKFKTNFPNFQMMQATPVGFLLPALFQISDNIQTATGNIFGKIRDTVQANHEATKAPL